jgi:dephospho-CoA kinase
MSTGPQPASELALRIGLTGGIASGKSTAAAHFAALGVPVIDADVVSRELTQPGTPLLYTIVERFGSIAVQRLGTGLLRPDSSLDRAALRRLIFDDAHLRHELEALLHPWIRERMEALAREGGGPYQIHVVPLLVETGAQRRYDRVLVVDSPESLQLARLQARDGIDLPAAQAMLAAQLPRAARLAAADDVIANDGDLKSLASQVSVLDRSYRDLTANQRAHPA